MSVPSLPTKVIVREVGLRDGLQSIATVMPTEIKCEWLRRAHAAGQREIEVGSFVPPRLLPQMADSAEVVAFAKTLPGLTVTTLVPNVAGARRAIAAGADHILLPISASRLHSRANVRKEPEAMVEELRAIIAERDASDANLAVEAGIGTAFGCGIQGHVDPAEALNLLRAALDAGADCVSMADTIGYADPRAVRDLFGKAVKIAGEKLWAGHFHDTRGLALANVYAAMEVGVSRFDSSLGGIGGCPFAPGASGNVASEDLVYMLHSMGVETGIDLDALLALRRFVKAELANEQFHGTIARAGLPRTFVSGRAT